MTSLIESMPTEYKDILEVCISLRLRKVTRLVTRIFDENLRAINVRSTQLPILITLGAEGTMSVAQLAKELVMDRTTLGQNLKPLEKDGLLVVAPGRDRRTREVQLTDAGKERLVLAIPMWQNAQKQVISSLEQDQLHDLQTILDQLLLLQR